VLVCVVHNVLGGKHVASEHHATADHHSTWNYAAKGPATWTGTCATGKAQSPINIDLADPKKIGFKQGKKIMSHNYWDEPGDEQYVMHNNGHALQIDLPKNTKYLLKKGGDKENKYVPMQIHIHFDPIHADGSEHTVNGKKYFAEIHIVHRREKYKQKKSFMAHDNGLLVIGMFVEKQKKGHRLSQDLDFTYEWSINKPARKEPNQGTSFAMQIFTKGAKQCKLPGKSKKLRPFPLAWLFPTGCRDGDVYEGYDYVNYKGSLTTPPCSEIVDWFVITGKTLHVNAEDAKAFQWVKNGDDGKMMGNNRPVQPLNGRPVYGVHGTL